MASVKIIETSVASGNTGGDMYDSPNGTYIKALALNTDWEYFDTQTVDGQIWYDLGGDQWISEIYAAPNINDLEVRSGTAKVADFTTATVYYSPNGSENTQDNPTPLPENSEWAYNKAATDSEGTIWFDVGRSQWVTTQEVVDEDAGGDIEWSGSGIFQYPTYSDGGINADMIRQAASDMYTSVSDDQINTIMAVAEHESGNNSNKINNWDKNAQEGHPSKGVLQFVGYTFDHYHVANHDNIWSSMDQLYALFNDATWASDISLGGWAPNGPVRFPA